MDTIELVRELLGARGEVEGAAAVAQEHEQAGDAPGGHGLGRAKAVDDVEQRAAVQAHGGGVGGDRRRCLLYTS